MPTYPSQMHIKKRQRDCRVFNLHIHLAPFFFLRARAIAPGAECSIVIMCVCAVYVSICATYYNTQKNNTEHKKYNAWHASI